LSFHEVTDKNMLVPFCGTRCSSSQVKRMATSRHW